MDNKEFPRISLAILMVEVNLSLIEELALVNIKSGVPQGSLLEPMIYSMVYTYFEESKRSQTISPTSVATV